MKFHVDARAVRRIMERGFGGIANFAEAWAERDAGLQRKAPLARDAKTIYGWLADGLPKRRETLFDFFAMLDVDPIAVLDLERSGFPESFGRLRLSFLLGGASAGAFRPLFELYHPGPDWPNSALSGQFFGRPWCVRDFEHRADAETSHYALIDIRQPESEAEQPRAFHIAYRRLQNNDAMWRPYGTVIEREGARHLIHENGFMQAEAIGPAAPTLRFETFFGPSPIEFRVASLSAFDLALTFPSRADGALRFIA